MRSHWTSTALRVLSAPLLVASLGGCGLILSLSDDGPPERQPPRSGPPVGGQDVVSWDGDAALDPDAADGDDGGLDAGLDDAGLDGGLVDGGLVDGGLVDGGLDDAGPDAGVDDGGLDAGQDGGPDDAGLDGGTPDGTCGTVSSLQDDFASAPPRAWHFDAVGDVVMTQPAGGIRFDVPQGSTGESGYGRLVASWLTSLREDDLRVRFSTLPSTKRLVTILTLVGPGGAGEYLRLRYDGSTYRASVVSSSEGIDRTEPHQSGTAYKHWRIRSLADGRVRFQVSSDGEEWRNLLTHEAPSWIDDVRVVLRVEGNNPNNAQAVVVDAVSGRYSSPSWCPLGALSESFDAALSPTWQIPADQPCTTVVANGQLTLTQSTDGTLMCSVATSAPRALEGQTLVVKLRAWAPSTLPDTFAGLRMLLGDTHGLYFGMREGTLRTTIQAFQFIDSQSGPAIEVPEGPLYLKLAVQGGIAYFSYGSDGVDFSPAWQRALPTVDDAQVTLALMTFGGVTTDVSDGATLVVEGLNAE